MVAWQRVVAIAAGPAYAPEQLVGEVVYSWQLVRTCAVDQDVMKLHEAADGGYDLSARPVNRRGVDALEYLLFAKDYEGTCSNVIAPKGWKDLNDSQRAAARCKFATVVAEDLSAQVKLLTDAWDASNEQSFLSSQWLKAGEAGAINTRKAALNLLSDSLFYLHDVVMDIKLGAALGIKTNPCGAVDAACVDALESKQAAVSKEILIANLEGFGALLSGKNAEGKEGASFDELLAELDAKDLADDMKAKTEAAIAAVNAIDGSLAEALKSDYASVLKAHDAVVALVKVLKGEFMLTVGLDIPKEAAGDND